MADPEESSLRLLLDEKQISCRIVFKAKSVAFLICDIQKMRFMYFNDTEHFAHSRWKNFLPNIIPVI